MRIISGTLKGRDIKTVQGDGYRPATARVREALFSMLEARGLDWSQARVLDLYAGSGSLAFEAISRGAQHASLVEIETQAIHCLQKNAQKFMLSGDRCAIIGMDVQKFLRSTKASPFTVIFIDPPYGKQALIPALTTLEKYGLYTEDAFIIAEIETNKKAQPLLKEPFETPFFDKCYGQTRVLAWHMKNE